jgi:hypothetical protein
METPQGSVLESRSESALWFAFFGVARAYCPLQGSIAPFGISTVDHLPRRSPRQPPIPKGLPLIRDCPSFASPLAHHHGLSFDLAPRKYSATGDQYLCQQHLVDSANCRLSKLVDSANCRLSKNVRPQCTPLMDGPRSQVHYPVIGAANPNPWVKRVRQIALQPRMGPSRLA